MYVAIETNDCRVKYAFVHSTSFDLEDVHMYNRPTAADQVVQYHMYVNTGGGVGPQYPMFLPPQPLLVLVPTCLPNHITPRGHLSHFPHFSLWSCLTYFG